MPTRKHLLAAEPKGEPPYPRNENAPEVMRLTTSRSGSRSKRAFCKRTVDHVKAVDGLTFGAPGQTLGVVGESGSGKTTLGLALMRLIRSEGRDPFRRQAAHALSFKQMRPLSAMQVVFQDPFGSLSPRMSIADIVGEGLAIHARNLSARNATAAWPRR
jgi:microcin C transport system ATP-binding protein